MNKQGRRIPFGPLILALGALCIAAAALLWRARNPSEATTGPLAGTDIGGPFTLVDQNGRTRTDKDFTGRYRLIYFGYTFCPDVCPVDVQKMAQGLHRFEKTDPARAARVQPIFVTIDPARDTPAVMKLFVAAFHPRLIGLTGTPDQIAPVLRAFRVYAAKRGEGPDYLMDHSSIIYLFGPDGAPISFLARDAAAQDVANELDRYVR